MLVCWKRGAGVIPIHALAYRLHIDIAWPQAVAQYSVVGRFHHRRIQHIKHDYENGYDFYDCYWATY